MAQEKSKHSRLIEELQKFFIYFVFFGLFFNAFTLYRSLILDAYSVSYIHYGYGWFESFILAKMVLLGEHFKLGEKYNNRPLIIPTLYKSIAFSLLVMLFTVAEHFLTGFLRGHSMETVYQHLIGEGKYEILARVFVMWFIFIPFFAFVETDRALGGKKLLPMFLHKPKQ